MQEQKCAKTYVESNRRCSHEVVLASDDGTLLDMLCGDECVMQQVLKLGHFYRVLQQKTLQTDQQNDRYYITMAKTKHRRFIFIETCSRKRCKQINKMTDVIYKTTAVNNKAQAFYLSDGRGSRIAEKDLTIHTSRPYRSFAAGTFAIKMFCKDLHKYITSQRML
jgi:hypothetical protein